MTIIMVPIIWFLDLWSKKKAEETLFHQERKYYCKEKVSLSLVENRGAFLGLFKNQPTLLYIFNILALTFIALLAMVHWLTGKNKLVGLGYALILGGAIGNFTDRIKRGYVTDFIAFYPKHKVHFNLADFAIFKGALLLLIFRR